MKNIKMNRPTVGDSVLSYVGTGQCARPSKYTKAEPRGTQGRGVSPTGVKTNRRDVMKDYDGPACHVKTTLYKANAAQASATERNVKLMPSRAGVSDFWRARAITGQAY